MEQKLNETMEKEANIKRAQTLLIYGGGKKIYDLMDCCQSKKLLDNGDIVGYYEDGDRKYVITAKDEIEYLLQIGAINKNTKYKIIKDGTLLKDVVENWAEHYAFLELSHNSGETNHFGKSDVDDMGKVYSISQYRTNGHF